MTLLVVFGRVLQCGLAFYLCFLLRVVHFLADRVDPSVQSPAQRVR